MLRYSAADDPQFVAMGPTVKPQRTWRCGKIVVQVSVFSLSHHSQWFIGAGADGFQS